MAAPVEKATSSKCYTGIVRRLLCSGSLPTHPSDQFVQPNIEQTGDQEPEKPMKHEANVKQAAASTPGVVARLMGLDSFPSTPLVPKHATLASLFRSRSVGSIDFLSYFDPIKPGHCQHRRVRTSISFREGKLGDYTGGVPHLEEVDELAGYECDDKLVTRKKRATDNFQQGKKEEASRIQNSENLQQKEVAKKPSKKLTSGVGRATSQKKDRRLSSKERGPTIKSVSNKEELVEPKCMKKRNKILAQKVHYEGSVPEVASRKPLRSKIASSRAPCASGSRSENGEVTTIVKRKSENGIKKEECYYKRMVEEICRLTEEDVKKDWAVVQFEDFEEMCRQFGQEILEALLQQSVDELMLLYGTRNKYLIARSM